MSGNDIAAGRVVAVLLADGWHRIVPGSFRVGPLSFGAEAGPGTPGFRFEEADPSRPYQPTALADPLDNVIAVRARAAHTGQRTDHGARLLVPAGRAAAQG
jgi:hypothetical protein